MPTEAELEETLARLKINDALGKLVTRYGAVVLDQVRDWLKFMDDCKAIGELMETEGRTTGGAE